MVKNTKIPIYILISEKHSVFLSCCVETLLIDNIFNDNIPDCDLNLDAVNNAVTDINI